MAGEDPEHSGQPAADADGGRAEQVPFSGALLNVVKNLHHQPILLFGLGAAIIVVGLGVWGSRGAATLVWPVLIVLLAALAAQVVVNARSSRATGGHIKARRGGIVHAGGDIRTDVPDGRGGDIVANAGEVSAAGDIVTGVRAERPAKESHGEPS